MVGNQSLIERGEIKDVVRINVPDSLTYIP